MIELFTVIPSWFIAVIFAVTTLVGRAGASRVFFDVIGVFYAERMLKDAKAKMATLQSLALDGLSGIEDAAAMFGDKMAALVDDVIPIATKIADARIEFEKFVQQADDADRIADEVIAIGEGFGFMADQALVAAARMAQLSSVVGPEVIPTATELGMQFGLIGGMETEEAMTKLINLQQQTNFMLGENTLEQFRAMDAENQRNTVRQETVRVMDQLNTIENRSAATMQHMTFVMNQFAAQADLANESIAGMAAQSATLIEAGENSGKAGRALKQIYARIGADTSGAAQAFENLGVATKDQNGDMRALSDLIRDAQEGYKAMSGEAKTNFAITVAGTHHYARFIKLMENNARTQELMLEANFRLNPAMDEVNIRLKNQVTDLRSAQAELDRYSGMLGDSLMPATIAATRAQADFNAVMVSIFGGEGGSAIQNMFIASELIREVGAGFFQNYVNVVQMNVALATQRTIMMALSGEQIVREDFMAAKMRERIVYQLEINQEQKEQEMLLAAVKRHMGIITGNMQMQAIEGRVLTQQQEQQLELEIGISELKKQSARANIMALKGQVQAQERMGFSVKQTESDIKTARRNQKDITSELDKQKGILAQMDGRYKKQKPILEDRINKLQTELNTDTKQLQQMEQELAIEKQIFQEKFEGSVLSEQETNELIQQIQLEEELLASAIATNEEAKKRLAISRALGDQERHRRKVQDDEKERQRTRQETKAMGQHALKYQELSLGVMAAGSALMMFSSSIDNAEKRQKMMRISMLLMNAALIPQLVSMSKMTQELFANTFAKRTNEVVTKKAIVTNNQEALSIRAKSAATKAYTVSLAAAGKAADAAFAAGARLLPIAGIIAAGFAIDFVLEKLGVYGDTVDELMTQQDNYTHSVKDVVDAYKENTMSIDELVSHTQTLEAELLTLENIQGIVAESRRDDLEAEIGLNEDLVRMIQARSFAEQDDAAIQAARNQIQAFEQAMALANAGNMSFGFSEGFAEDIFAMMDPRIQAMVEDGIDTLDEFDAHIQSITEGLDSIMNEGENATGQSLTHIEEMNDALNDFNNAREELFFGFKAGNVTGDLIKQIEQKGVENFVANTEIIMTNNFNGMTTDEVADEILNKIDERAALQGINVALT
jgi:TP901 family phage tail tape measure protein